MNNLRFLQLGWIVACAILGITLAGGFQGPSDKIGVVDMASVMERSDFGKQNQESFTKMRLSREGLLEFIDTHRVLTNEQAQQLRDLSMKPNPTKEDTARIDTIKAEVVAASKRSAELATKGNLTPEERTLVEEYARRSQTMNDVATRWYREFSTDMSNWAEAQKLEGVRRAREATQQVAKEQGYTVVFEIGVAPYGASDLTDAALKAMNAKK